MTTPVRDDDLELRLRRDAPAWGGGPTDAARAALRARVASLPRAHAPRWPLVAAALAAAAALVAYAVFARSTEEARDPVAPTPSTTRAFDVTALEAQALAPLRKELAGLARDGELLARGVWQQVPEPVRRLLE